MKSGVWGLAAAAALLLAGCAGSMTALPVGTEMQAMQVLPVEAPGESGGTTVRTAESVPPAADLPETPVPEQSKLSSASALRYSERSAAPDTVPKTAEILKARYLAFGYSEQDAEALIAEKGFEWFQEMRDTSDGALRAVMEEYLAGRSEEGGELRALTELRHFEVWQLRILNNAGYTASEVLQLSEQQLNELFAPGAVLPGDGGFEPDIEQHKELMARGITDSESMALARLGYSYEEMLSLTGDKLRFLLPNTGLIQRLVQRGYPYEMVKSETFVIQAGYSGYRELLDQAYQLPEGYRPVEGGVQSLIPASYTAALEQNTLSPDAKEVVLNISHGGPDDASPLGCPNAYRFEKWDELNGIWVQLNREQIFPAIGGPFIEPGARLQEHFAISIPQDSPQGVYRIAGYFARAVAVGEERSFLFQVQ